MNGRTCGPQFQRSPWTMAEEAAWKRRERRHNRKGTCREVAEYIASQQAKGWPGSVSICMLCLWSAFSSHQES